MSELFQTTDWQLVRDAQSMVNPSDVALSQLYRDYWKPLYVYTLRRGFTEEQAEDLVQGFFLKVMEKRYLASADEAKGRFRTFLLICLQRFLSNEKAKLNTRKRGGHLQRVRARSTLPGELAALPDAAQVSPEALFDREWALSIIGRAMAELRRSEEAAGRGRFMDAVEGTLLSSPSEVDIGRLAERLGTARGNAKVALHRLRKRLRSCVYEQVRRTVASDADAEDELRLLLGALAAAPDV